LRGCAYFFRAYSAFFAASPQKTRLFAAIPRKPLRALLRDFRSNPGFMGEQEFCEGKIPTSPLRPTGFAFPLYRESCFGQARREGFGLKSRPGIPI
jgi:hypothetical protein